MSFLSTIFGKFGKEAAAPTTASGTGVLTGVLATGLGMYNPGFGALIETIGNAVYAVEIAAENNGTSGADKKVQVQHIIDVSAPLLIQTLQTITGKPVLDASALAPALDTLIDDIVAFFHAVGVFPPKKSTPAPVTAPPVDSPAPAHAG